jgi:hypothetical protein
MATQTPSEPRISVPTCPSCTRISDGSLIVLARYRAEA